MNAIRIPLVKSALLRDTQSPHQSVAGQPPLHGCSILDVGCGGGILSEVRESVLSRSSCYQLWREKREIR